MVLCVGHDIYRQFCLREPAKLKQSYVLWDGSISKEVAPGRGVFLKFLNFHGQLRQWTARIYFRSVYRLYPRPVLVARPSAIVNTAPQLLENNSYPNESSLWDRGVRTILIVDLNPVSKQPFVEAVKWLGQ